MTNSKVKWLVAGAAALAVISGGLTLGSNMGFKANYSVIVRGDAPAGDTWIALPFNNPYATASALCSQLGLTSTNALADNATVARFDPVAGFDTFICGGLGAGFTVMDTGAECEGIKITETVARNVIVVGSHNPAQTCDIFGPRGSAPAGDNWVSLPLHTTSKTAAAICTEAGLTSTNALADNATVARFDPTTGFDTFICGGLGSGFTPVTGESIKITETAGPSTWLPSHY